MLVQPIAVFGAALLLGACSAGGGDGATSGRGGAPSAGGTAGTGIAGSMAGTTGSVVGGNAGSVGSAGSGGSAGPGGSAGGGGNAGGTGGTGPGQAGSGPSVGGAGSAGRNGDGGGQAAGTSGTGGGTTASSCVGKTVPTANPTVMGPFQTATDKNVGPLTGYTPDPIHGDMQSHFNVYRPKDLTTGGYCFPIVIWSNGHGNQPEPSPPQCVLNSCGHYATVMQQFASHGFVVVVALSSTTSKGDPPPSAVGLDWVLKQADDPSSPYYHHLDTAHIGAAGHSEGGLATSKLTSDPHITAISSVSGPSANPMIHQPTLLFFGGKEANPMPMNVANVFNSITQYPAMTIDNLSVGHVDWSSQGTKGPTISGLIAWFRAHLMNDTASRKYFYGASCTFCTDSRVTVMRNSLMMMP